MGIVENIIAAKRIPIDTIETRIDANTDKITALGELRTLLGSLKDSLAKLRGTMTVGNTSDVFSAKQVFATTSRTDGATPSAAANLLAVNVTNSATAAVIPSRSCAPPPRIRWRPRASRARPRH